MTSPTISRGRGRNGLQELTFSNVRFTTSDSQNQEQSWSNSRGKRAFDLFCALCALVLLSPLFFVAALLVAITSDGPLLFRQTRIGEEGTPFTILKFRTMYIDAAQTGPSVTKVGDRRLTPVGGFLRRLKLDELPQLINVVRGDMSLVGPRPKVPRHQIESLPYRPGITGAASLAFRNEESLLRTVPEENLDEYQLQVLMPVKNYLDSKYMSRATLASDLSLLVQTVLGGKAASTLDLPLQFERSLHGLSNALHADSKRLEINTKSNSYGEMVA